MAFERRENVAFIDAESVAKLKINMRGEKNVKFGIYDLDFKPLPKPRYTVLVTFRDITLYHDSERFYPLQTIKYNRLKKTMQCPCCEKQTPRVHKFDFTHENEMFICSDCYELFEQNQNEAI